MASIGDTGLVIRPIKWAGVRVCVMDRGTAIRSAGKAPAQYLKVAAVRRYEHKDHRVYEAETCRVWLDDFLADG